MNPSFVVPAEYFYAFGVNMPPQITPEERYQMTILQKEQQVRKELDKAIAMGVISENIGVNKAQAARRLEALGSTEGVNVECQIDNTTTGLNALIQKWLDEPGDDISLFWTEEIGSHAAAHLDLLLCVVTDNNEALIAAIKALGISTVDELTERMKTTQQWRDLFFPPANTPGQPPPPPLPSFTEPGSPEERLAAFIRHLRKYFGVNSITNTPSDPVMGAPPTFESTGRDLLNVFTDRYKNLNNNDNNDFVFRNWDEQKVQAALDAIFNDLPSDPSARAWLEQALRTIHDLYILTADIGQPDLHFSLMEALYARGFTSKQDIQELTLEDFRAASTGTVAFDLAAAIYDRAEGNRQPEPLGQTQFKPINPDGHLTNCIPPLHLSPLGPVAYLHELLKVSSASTCDDPLPENVENTLTNILAKRRGPLGELHATRTNLETPLPLIDIVNECLEAIAANAPNSTSGVVYDTAIDELAGHQLRTNGAHPDTGNGQVTFQHDPATLFEALPEHSSPATPVAQPSAYNNLKRDFSAPTLPYSQPLDICRSYLRQLHTSRYDVMRRFRKDITEFVLSPVAEPAEFQRHLWRYPVRIDIARQYLSITPEEYDLLFTQDIVETETPPEGRLLLWELYGFESSTLNDRSWTEFALKVSEFLKRTGLTYCEFLSLWKAEFVKFRRAGEISDFPDCEPCYLDNYLIQFENPINSNDALKQLAVFIRLWHKLQQVNGAKYSFSQLRDICDILQLFKNGAINPDFIRQLAAFQILRDRLGLSLTDKADNQPGTGADRTHLLALWVGESASKWAWAVDEFLDQIQPYAQFRHKCGCRPPEFIKKFLAENLDLLSRLAGFDPSRNTDTWHALPTHTLRFAEILAKIYASEFGVGEILFLFTADEHLNGNDPFPLQSNNEAIDLPFDLPDDEDCFSLWALRKKLLAVEISACQTSAWTWTRIEAALRNEFGFVPPADEPDPLLSLGEHFFPSIVEACGCPVDLKKRQYRVDLANTSVLMWNTPPEGPFRYDPIEKQLWTQLPLTDEAVIAKLSRIRQLTPEEQSAVRELYFLPRVDLAHFAFIFSNFAQADICLVQEPDETKRWIYFQQEFTRYYARCQIIVEHLASHVEFATGQPNCEGLDLAWRLLQHLLADENKAKTTWESDDGKVPAVSWQPQPNGGAFAVLLGLTGTGLLGEFMPGDAEHKIAWEDDKLIWKDGEIVWREVRGPMNAFGLEENAWNCPVPTILPAMNLTLTPDQGRFVAVRNGFAMKDNDGAPLGGAQGFAVRWRGVLLIEHEGMYQFWAGLPTPDGEEPDCECRKNHHWRVTLKRGQKTCILLSHQWPDEAPATCTPPLLFKRGAYQLIVEYVQPQPAFNKSEDVCPQATGFQLKYAGPDSCNCIIAVPVAKLFRDVKDNTLADQVTVDGAAKRFLEIHFTSTLRDIRRTYQRAFKSLLFAHRFSLSAKAIADDGQSEIGYMLAHQDIFLGMSYYRQNEGFSTHRAYFDFNFLSLKDNYYSPTPAQDLRVQPSLKRQQALFDWWEHIFDYTMMRREAHPAGERPVWLLFHEAAEKHPDDPAHLLRHMGVKFRHATIVLRYYQAQNAEVLGLSSDELEDERWAVRVWQAEKWIRALLLGFAAKDIRDARPALWAADDPSSLVDGETLTGNENLTKFYRDGCFENGEPRRYEEVKRLNNGLRQRARVALLAYLCGMSRVPLPWDGFVRGAKDLSDLLLLDVEVGICEKASRIEEGISALQIYIQRCRLGLELDFVISLAFALLWNRHFVTFHVWKACKHREIYRENWIDWEELQKSQRTETFRFLEAKLRETTLTVPVPGGLEYWPSQPLPTHPKLTLLQQHDPDPINRLSPSSEGLNLLGTPEQQAHPSWLAALSQNSSERNDNGEPEPDNRLQLRDTNNLPLWMQAAIQLGVRFIRVAAASKLLASTGFAPHNLDKNLGCCAECGKPHPAAIDEYYFWLLDSRYYNPQNQDADLVAPLPQGPDGNGDDGGRRLRQQIPESAWHKPEQLPKLLYWEAEPMVHLAWCRIHNGEFQQHRRSDEGVRVTKGQIPELKFLGRKDDSLSFQVIGAILPLGYTNPPEPGFRYDLATDTAAVLPLVVPPAPSNINYPGGLLAYPYFAYFTPGARLIPPSLFSPVLAIARSLRTHCRFEAALKWYELFFNPLREDCTWCLLPTDREGNGNNEGENLTCCQSVGLPAATLQKRSITLHYLETMLQWVDALMHRNSPEAFQQARLICDTEMRILGIHPHTVIEEDSTKTPQKVAEFIPHWAPLNPRLLALYEQVSDRLTLIHSCLNARRLHNGLPHKDMPYWGNSSTRNGWQTTVEPCLDEVALCCCPSSPYRFLFLLEKAKELAREVSDMGAALLAAYEKGDAEYLSTMRTTHERQLLNLTLEVRQNQWREADWQVQALQKTKESAQTRKRYYDALIKNGLNNGERQYKSFTNTGLDFQSTSRITEGGSQAANLVPDIYIGTVGPCPKFESKLPIGEKIAQAVAAAARILNSSAETNSTNASLNVTQAGWDRREEEWRHQVEVLEIEIEQIERQILAAERRRDIMLRELNNHQQQMEQAAEVHDFLRDKFTNHELYLWQQQETTALHYQMYELALQYVLQLQHKFNYEHGYTARKFLPDEVWDNLHEGLLAGERLQLSLRQMEKAYLCENVREYELTKHFSLRLHFPLEFLQLKTTGYCEIEIPEWMFDLDYPGHYMRRIKNVMLTIPCVVGPYTGVHCRLTLLSSTTRVDPRLTESPTFCCGNGKSSNGYQLLPNDLRAIKQYAAMEAIATSSGQNDSGMFELSFRDERYLPFEFAGAVSRWRVELPQENNQFDVDTFSDEILELKYTAREGGEVLRRAANEFAQQNLPGGGLRLFDIKHEFPDIWHRFQICCSDQKLPKQLDLRLDRNMFPFLPGHRDLWIEQLQILFEAPGTVPSAHRIVEFSVEHRIGDMNADRYECEVQRINCIASVEWPGLYHGVLDIRLGPLSYCGDRNLGTFRFPADIGLVSRAFLFCSYKVR